VIAAIRAEWTKLRTVSSSAWLLAALVVVTVGVGAIFVGTVHTDMCATPAACDEDTTRLALSGVWAGQIVAAILGALVMTTEYGTRVIGVTLAARPRRWQVYMAKLAVVGGVMLVAAAAAVALSVAAGRSILPGNGFTSEHGYPPLSLLDGSTARAAVGTVLYLVLIALLSLGIGAIIRDTAVSLTTVFAVLFVLPILTELVSDPVWQERLQRWSPTSAGLAVQNTLRLDELPIAPWPGLGVLGMWALGSVLAGYARFARRAA
jgi:ABC-2 type transport system permease protein